MGQIQGQPPFACTKLHVYGRNYKDTHGSRTIEHEPENQIERDQKGKDPAHLPLGGGKKPNWTPLPEPQENQKHQEWKKYQPRKKGRNQKRSNQERTKTENQTTKNTP